MSTSAAQSSLVERIKQVNRGLRESFPLACERALKIKPKDAPLAPFVLRWPQRYIVDRYLQPAFDRKEPLALLVLKARQDGISTLSLGWTYHKVRWYPGVTAVVAAHQDDTVASLHDMAKRFHENLPRELRPPTDRMNRKELHYLTPLDSSLRVRAGKYLDISRGKTPQIVVLSEIPYYPAPDVIMSGVTEAVPDYGPTLILMEGTAAGIDTWHYELWQQIGRDKRRQQIGRRIWDRAFLPWFWSPDKTLPMPAKWDFPKEDRKEFRGIQKRFKLRDDQIMWYWNKYREFVRTHQGTARRELQQEHPCLIGATRVCTTQGLLRIDGLQETQGLSTAYGPLVRWYDQGTRPVFTLTTTLGYAITGTYEHRLATPQGDWKSLGAFCPGEKVALIPPRFAEEEYVAPLPAYPSVVSSVRITESWGRFLGYFMGDGSYNNDCLSFACCREDMDVVDDITSLFLELFGVSPHLRVMGRKHGGIEVRAGMKGLAPLLQTLGVLRTNNSRSYKRRVCVPEAIWRSPRHVVRAFLQGLFEAGGFNDYQSPRVVFFSQYPDFLRDVHLLLLGFGITARLTERPAINGQGFKYTARELQLRKYEAITFNRVIGFLSARKRGRCPTEAILIPYEDTAIDDAVESVEPSGTANVYDLEIASQHCFASHGMLSHNCTAEDAFVSGGECIFPDEAMDTLKDERRQPLLGFDMEQTGSYQWTMVQRDLSDEPPLLIWEEPTQGYEYGIGVDVSRGVGRDESAVVVVRMPGFVQVAHWSDAHTSTRDLAYITARIACYYATKGAYPICTVELNDAGLHTNLELAELSSTLPIQLYIWEYLDRLGAQPVDHRSRTGWMTNQSTKPIMVGVANSLLLAGQCTVPSGVLQADMARCQEVLPGRYKTGGRDLAVAWLLALITCWRKIARFQFQGYETIGQPKMAPENPYAHIPDAFKDTRWLSHIRQNDSAYVSVGDPDTDWLVQ